MRTNSWSPQKCDSLRRHASLNPHPEQVNDLLFHTHPFFDPYDRVQVKYEMLRRVLIEGKPVGITVAAFGFSRVRWAQLRKRFEEDGLAGLLPQRRGPQRASKLSEAVLTFVQETLQQEPALRMGDVPKRVAQKFGVFVHVRSIQRALANRRLSLAIMEKKDTLLLKPMQVVRYLQARARTRSRNAMRSCATLPWKPTEQKPRALLV